MDYSIFLDTGTLNAVRKLGTWQPTRTPQVQDAMSQSLDLLQTTAVDYMYSTFKHSSGQLADAFHQSILPTDSDIQGTLENTSKYAFRREYGFSGMTDSLGRYYPIDEGIGYDQYALDKSRSDILTLFSSALQAALSEAVK